MKYIVFVIALVCCSCVSVPKQAPTLSEELGKRISAIEKSHTALLNSFFDEKRLKLDEFIENEWLPLFAKNFFENEQIEAAWLEIVESKNKKDRLDFLVMVGPQLQAVINDKRQELVAPLNELEHTLERMIREEYDMARSMNNTLTSYLHSASKVKENQQRYLNMLGITEEKITDAINQTESVVNRLVKGAEKVEQGKEKLDEKSQEFKSKIEEIRNKIK